MYQDILNGLYKAHSIQPGGEAAFLQTLQPYVKGLRNLYQKQNVIISYSNSLLQSAYLLAYYPAYSQIIGKLCLTIIPSTSKVSACFFGGGPAPEAYGFIKLLPVLNNNQVLHSVDIHIMDIATNAWQFSRNIAEKFIIPPVLGNAKLNMQGINFDLTTQGVANNVLLHISNSNLVMFQNCFNELSVAKYPIIKDNVLEIFNALPAGGQFVIVDMHNYTDANKLVYNIEAELLKITNAQLKISFRNLKYFDCQKLIPVPQLITTNLLTGNSNNPNGLIPKRNINYRALVIEKL